MPFDPCANPLGALDTAVTLYPFVGMLLGSKIASEAWTFSSVSVITNALRLTKFEL